MKLRKEYNDIYEAVRRGSGVNSVQAVHTAIQVAVERCQELADRQPRKHMSDEEILHVFDRTYEVQQRRSRPSPRWFCAVRGVIDAAFEKQKEQPPEPLDFEKLKTGEWEVLCCGRPTAVICAATLAASPEHYTMRRKA